MDPGRRPPLPARVLGKTESWLVARAPWTWPLWRGLNRRWWDRMASHWDERVGSDAERLAPLAAACDLLEGEPSSVLELGTGTGIGALSSPSGFPGARYARSTSLRR